MTEAAGKLLATDRARFGDDPEAMFRANLARVEARIQLACDRVGRARGDVQLLPISKTVPAPILRHAVAAGITRFGENKIQEALGKSESLADLAPEWVIVGHLQTNKVKFLSRFAAEFHALDSPRLAERLDRRLERDGRSLDVYVQVNTSGEDSKFGLAPDAVPGFLDELAEFPRLRPKGLMTLALFHSDMDHVRPCFQLLRRLRDEAVTRHPMISGLSMGMTGDFETAIEEGATVIRVGQAIFGARPTPDGVYWPGLA